LYLIVTGPRLLSLSVQVSFVALGSITALLGLLSLVGVACYRLCWPTEPSSTAPDASSYADGLDSAHYAAMNSHYAEDMAPFDPLAKDNATERLMDVNAMQSDVYTSYTDYED
jgi:hypothetical protein